MFPSTRCATFILTILLFASPTYTLPNPIPPKGYSVSTSSDVPCSTHTTTAPTSAAIEECPCGPDAETGASTTSYEESSTAASSVASSMTEYTSVTSTATSTASSSVTSSTGGTGQDIGEGAGKFGTLILRLHEHVEIRNETDSVDNRSDPDEPLDYIIHNNEPYPYAAKWTFIAYSTNEKDGEWGSEVDGSLEKNRVTCNLQLNVASSADEVVIDLTDSPKFVVVRDTGMILDIECEGGDWARVA